MITIEPNPVHKLHQHQVWAAILPGLSRAQLINLATNPNQPVKNINVRADALLAIEDALKKRNVRLTGFEVEQLYKLIANDKDFPVLVDTNEIIVEEVTNEKGHEDLPTKKKVKKEIEENVALLKSFAAFLIVDYGRQTRKFQEIHHNLVKTISGLLGEMIAEADHIFVQEGKTSFFFNSLVEALYFIDEDSARPFMHIFNIGEESFSFDRRTKKAS